jgi:N6-L-threonylcarbamoyladenine synthase
MNVLGIETSCDETAAAVVVDGIDVLANVVSSQIALHAGFGGVVPELAAREHLRNLGPVVGVALTEAGLSAPDLDAVAVTYGPGLVPALLVGVAYAQGLAAAGGLPLVGVNHFLGHIYSCFMAEPELLSAPHCFPAAALVVSGGHTSLVRLDSDGAAAVAGQTLDDAAGEAFDKAARILDLGYPGGPVIDRLAREGDPDSVRFPRALTGGTGKPVAEADRLNFSFSGLKTALLYRVGGRDLEPAERADLAASYQAAIVDVLVAKTMAAADAWNAPTVLLCGGVACNSGLRAAMAEAATAAKRRLVIAPREYCTDNAAMIAGLAYHYVRTGRAGDLSTTVAARLAPELGVLPFAPAVRGAGPPSAGDYCRYG